MITAHWQRSSALPFATLQNVSHYYSTVSIEKKNPSATLYDPYSSSHNRIKNQPSPILNSALRSSATHSRQPFQNTQGLCNRALTIVKDLENCGGLEGCRDLKRVLESCKWLQGVAVDSLKRCTVLQVYRVFRGSEGCEGLESCRAL